ncbi:MAG TPA: hypothetical protein VF062_21790 [Candidatus Limnocylindrales bacterium]
MGERETIRFADFVASRATALYRHALTVAPSPAEAASVVQEALVRTGMVWRAASRNDPELLARSLITRLAAAPVTPAEGNVDPWPPPDLHARVASEISRRVRRQHGRVVVAAALAAVGLAALALAAIRDDPGPVSRAQPSATASPPRSGAASPPRSGAASPPEPGAASPQAPAAGVQSAAPEALNRLVDRSRAVVFPMRQPDGLYFRAEALSPNGIAVGRTGLDYDPYRASDGLVWAVGPHTGRRVALNRPPAWYPWGHAAGTDVAAWAEDSGDRFELFCADPAAPEPSARQVSRTGVAKLERPVHAGGDAVVWTDESGSAHWVRGCGGTPRALPIWDVLGLAYPEVFYTDSGRLRSWNLESGQSSDVDGWPGGGREAVPFAAGGSWIVWVDGSTLTVNDRRAGTRRTVPLSGLPHFALARPGRLTLGDRLVAYAFREFESSREAGFVYDLASATLTVTATETFAARDRLLWREGTDYLVAPAKRL